MNHKNTTSTKKNRLRKSYLTLKLILNLAAALLIVTLQPDYLPAISDICPDICSTVDKSALFSCKTDRNDFCTVYLPKGIEFIISSVRKNFTPVVLAENKSELLSDGNTVQFTASLKDGKNIKPPENYEFRAYYSTNDRASWQLLILSYDPINEYWTEKVQLKDKPKKIYYFFHAKDTDGSSYIEIPCPTTSFPPSENDCTVPLSADQSYENYADLNIEPHLDILSSHVGYGNGSFFFDMEAAADIDIGKLFPMNANTYFTAIIDTASPDRAEPFQDVAILIYSPLLYTPANCALFKRFSNDWDYDYGALKCQTAKNKIFFRVPRKLLPWKDESGYFSTVLGTVQIHGEDSGVVKDYTMLTTIRHIERILYLK
ncbi:MAG: hypothetical protein AB1546_06895 [bacterium]